GGEPVELELILIRSDELPVRHIDIKQRHAANSGPDEPARRRFAGAGESPPDIDRLLFGDKRHSIVSGLTEEFDIVSSLKKGIDWESIVRDLRFLQAEHRGLIGGQPRSEERRGGKE